MNKKHFDVEQYEDEILKDFEKGEFVSVGNLEEEKNIARQAAAQNIAGVVIRVKKGDIIPSKL